MEVTGADMKDGMLHINVERIVPEDKKPKSIKIK
jgi:HSP20 family molecular chaperone IbpA